MYLRNDSPPTPSGMRKASGGNRSRARPYGLDESNGVPTGLHNVSANVNHLHRVRFIGSGIGNRGSLCIPRGGGVVFFNPIARAMFLSKRLTTT